MPRRHWRVQRAKEILVRRGIHQRELAARYGRIDEPTLSRILNGLVPAPDHFKTWLSGHLGIAEDELFSSIDDGEAVAS